MITPARKASTGRDDRGAVWNTASPGRSNAVRNARVAVDVTLPDVSVDLAVAMLVIVLHRRLDQEDIHLGGAYGPRTVTVAGRTVAEVLAAVGAVEKTPDAQPRADLSVVGKADDATGALSAVLPTGGDVAGAVLVSDGSRDADELREVAAQWAAAAASAQVSPLADIATVTLTDPASLDLIAVFDGDGEPAEPARAVHLVVADRARERPEATAVVWRGGSITHRQLDRAANAFATCLRAAGAGPDTLVAIVAERGPELIVALLAVLRCGAAYTCLEVDLPRARRKALLADSRPVVVVATPGMDEPLPLGTSRVDLPALETLLDPASWDVADVLVEVPADALAYLSYTSGSTGAPKGACVPHRAVSRLVRGADWIQLDADDVVLQLAPVAFDASTFEIWGALAAGARVAVHPAGTVELDQLAETVTGLGVTVAWLTAGLFHQMVTGFPEAFAGLRHVLAGGDVVNPQQVSTVLERNPGLTFTNGYGPTENTTFTTCWTSTASPTGTTVPIGRPVNGTRVHVLDAALKPVPPGVAGDLYAAGAGLAQGYLRQPGATAARFVPEPRGSHGSRMYRTGDRARWRRDGSLEFLGREDHQLKIQGYRVEPGEVEAALGAHPDVGQAVVIGIRDAGRTRLLAYATAAYPDDDDPVELERRLRAELREELPAHMVPWAVIVVDGFPLTANGKVDRTALPAARRAPRPLSDPYLAPSGATEKLIAAEWGDLLGIEPIGADDDFFALGGHSLIAAELLSRLGQRFGVEISARTLYLRPTVAELADALDHPIAATAAPAPTQGALS